MVKNLVAQATITIDVPLFRVWDAITNPDAIREYMFGTTVETDWQEGSQITWNGEWEGKLYKDIGEILKVRPLHLLQYSHYSPMTGLPEIAENFQNVTIELTEFGSGTRVSLTQDNNSSSKAQEDSKRNWTMMLEGLKKYLE